MLAILFLLVASGCGEQLEEMERNRDERDRVERVQQERVEQIKDERQAWEEAGDASLDLTEQLDVDLSYEDVYGIFGYEGDLKMNLTGARGERKVYEWRLEGGVDVRVTFDDGKVTKWEVR